MCISAVCETSYSAKSEGQTDGRADGPGDDNRHPLLAEGKKALKHHLTDVLT